MGAFPKCAEFPISRDPPEGGTRYHNGYYVQARFQSFQFLGIPPKGELEKNVDNRPVPVCFQFLGIPPKGEHDPGGPTNRGITQFPISRDPPEGGTDSIKQGMRLRLTRFPISRDPPEGGPSWQCATTTIAYTSFQFLGIPPKGEPVYIKIKKERRWRGLSLLTDGVDQAPSAWGSSQIQGWSRALHRGFTQTVD